MGTRDKIIDASIGLMRRSGLSGAGVNEIIKASGAPKGSMYHYFPGGKRQIATEALVVHGQRILAAWDEAMSRHARPREKIKALFKLTAQRLEAGEYRLSCPAGTVCLDVDDDLDAVREAIAAVFTDWIALLARHIPIEDRRRRQSFAGLLLTAIEGGYIRGRAERSSKAFSEAAAWLGDIAEREMDPGS